LEETPNIGGCTVEAAVEVDLRVAVAEIDLLFFTCTVAVMGHVSQLLNQDSIDKAPAGGDNPTR
jgi:hypothetical protein